MPELVVASALALGVFAAGLLGLKTLLDLRQSQKHTRQLLEEAGRIADALRRDVLSARNLLAFHGSWDLNETTLLLEAPDGEPVIYARDPDHPRRLLRIQGGKTPAALSEHLENVRFSWKLGTPGLNRTLVRVEISLAPSDPAAKYSKALTFSTALALRNG